MIMTNIRSYMIQVEHSRSLAEDIATTRTKVIDEYAANLNAFSKATGSSSLSSDA